MSLTPLDQVISEYQNVFSNNLVDHFGNFFGQPGVPNRSFLFKFFHGHDDDFYDFLTRCSLISSEMKCEKCGSDMKVIKRNDIGDKRQWFCGKMRDGKRCNFKRSIRHNSFFTGSKLPIAKILMLVFSFFEGLSVDSIFKELGIFSHAIADWRRYCTDVLIDFIETNTDKVGGVGKIVEVDESKIGKRKFNRGHFVEGQWVFGGVERGSGRCFIVAIPDRSAETLLDLIAEWIEPGTKVIADCWKGYDRLSKDQYELLRVNHSLYFKDPVTGAHTNTVESLWRHFKASLPEYNRQGDFGGYIAWFMFRQICWIKNEDPFLKFNDIIRRINWADWHIVSGGAGPGSSE